MRTFFFDVETTGVDLENSAIIQIAGILDIDGKVEDTLEILVRPHEGALIDDKALEVNKTTRDDLKNNPNRIDPKEAYLQVLKFCRFPLRVFAEHRIHAAGYNAHAFDMPLLVNMGKRAGDAFSYCKFHWPVIDVAVLAADRLRKTRGTLPNFKLMTVAEALGVATSGTAHDAVFDIKVTRDLYYKLQN